MTSRGHHARTIVEQMLQNPPDKHCVLNVNFPIATPDEIKGVKICRQAYAKYEEDFLERLDPGAGGVVRDQKRGHS